MDSPRRGLRGRGTPSTDPRAATDRGAAPSRHSSRSINDRFPDRATRLVRSRTARPASDSATSSPTAARSSPTARWARCCSPTGCSSATRPRSGTSTQPEVIRRIQRGYLDAGSRIIMTNTFGGNRLRLGLHGLEERVDELNRTAAILPAPRSTRPAAPRSSPATSAPAARSSRRSGRSTTTSAVDVFRGAGRLARRRRRRPDLDRDDVRPQRDQGGHRGRPAGRARHRRSSRR